MGQMGSGHTNVHRTGSILGLKFLVNSDFFSGVQLFSPAQSGNRHCENVKQHGESPHDKKNSHKLINSLTLNKPTIVETIDKTMMIYFR